MRSDLLTEFLKTLIQLILIGCLGVLFTKCLDDQSKQRERRAQFYEAGQQAWEQITELTSRRMYRIERVSGNLLGSADQLDAKDREHLEATWREYMDSVDEWNSKLPINHGKLRRFFSEAEAASLIAEIGPSQKTGLQKAFVHAHEQLLDLKVICARDIKILKDGTITPRRCNLRDSKNPGIRKDVAQAKDAIAALKKLATSFNQRLTDLALKRLAEIDAK
jgi:hypothetical protein